MKSSLNQQILAGVVIGVLLGLFLLFVAGVESGFAFWTLYACDIVKSVFINMLKMVLIPLVFVSITVGIANLQGHAQMGKVWKLALLYFMTTTGCAVLLGLISVNIFQPGKGLSTKLFQNQMDSFSGGTLTLAEFVQNFISQLFINPVAAMADTQILATVVFAIMLGIALIMGGSKTKTIHKVLTEGFEIIMRIVGWVMVVAPYGIGALVAKLVATQNIDLLEKLGFFIILVIGTFLFHGLVVLPSILRIVTGFNIKEFFTGMSKALITAFSTSSSSATLPITLQCTQDNLKVDKDVSGFVLPLGATINMDGTALYESFACIFVANLMGVELSLVQQITVFFMSMVAAIGAPGIPSAGMVTMAMVLESVGLPIEAIGILLPIDKLLDAVRTAINVEGDAIGSVVVDKLVNQ